MRARKVAAVQRDQFPPLRSFELGGVRYRLGHQIGVGSTSKVYSGQDDWGNQLAVKVYKGAKDQNAWRHESAMLQRFRGTGVVQLQCSFMHEAHAYLVMRDAGIPVHRLRIPTPELRRKIMMQVAVGLLQALHGLHVRDYMHCDVNPQNVLVQNPGRTESVAVRLADFALCRAQAELLSGNKFPMAYWLPPHEYFDRSRKIVPAAVDVFHASAVLFQLLKGEVLDYSRDEILADKLQCDALRMHDPLAEALAWGLTCRAEERPTAIDLWRSLHGAFVQLAPAEAGVATEREEEPM